MEKEIILEINRINKLMGAQNIFEGAITRFIKIGVDEGCAMVGKALRDNVELLEKGLISLDEFKIKCKEDIKVLKNYLDDVDWKILEKQIDDIADTEARINDYQGALDNIQRQMDETAEAMKNSERNVEIELNKTRERLKKNKENFLKKLFGPEGVKKFLNDFLNKVAKMEKVWKEAISRYSHPSDIKNWLRNKFQAYDDAFLSRITDPAEKTKWEDLLNNTREERVNVAMKEIEKLPEYQTKFSTDKQLDFDFHQEATRIEKKASTDRTPQEKIFLKKYKEKYPDTNSQNRPISDADYNEFADILYRDFEVEWQRINNKPKNQRTPSEQKFHEKYYEHKKGDAAASDMAEIRKQYDASKKSNSVEFKLKTNLLSLLGPEWLQGLKMLIENWFGFRRTAAQWRIEAETTTRVLSDFLESKSLGDPTIKSNVDAWKSKYNQYMSQIKNELQLGVEEWASNSRYNFDGLWGDIKADLLNKAGSSANPQEALAAVNDLITRCETKNYKSGGVFNFPGMGGWKSIGDILEITKNECSIRGWNSELSIIENLKNKIYDAGQKFKSEFAQTWNDSGVKELFNKFKERMKTKEENQALRLLDRGVGLLKFIFYDTIKLHLRKFLFGTYANLETLIVRFTSKGISRTAGSNIPQMLTRLGSLWFYLYLISEIQEPLYNFLTWGLEAFSEWAADKSEFISTTLTTLGLPVDFTDKNFGETLIENVQELFGLEPQSKYNVIDLGGLFKVIKYLRDIDYSKDNAKEEAKKLNEKINTELDKIDEDYIEKYKKAKLKAENGDPTDLNKMQNESSGTALIGTIDERNERVIAKYYKNKFPQLCSDFGAKQIKALKKNFSYKVGMQPMVIKALVDKRNESFTQKLQTLYDKYKNDPELLARETAEFWKEAKRTAEGSYSSNTGLVPIYKDPDGVEWALFSASDGYAYVWTPAYNEMINTLKENKFEAKDGKVVMIKGNNTSFEIKSKNICELKFEK